jgi:DNA-binding transcriptional ArsR family regulator
MSRARRIGPSRSDQLDLVFGALGNKTRRAMLARLAKKPAMVTELAEPFDLSLPAVSRHIRVLEHVGLI